MHLTLGRPRADGAPAHQIRRVLRRYRVQELAAHGKPQPGQIQQQRSPQPQALVDGEGAIQARIVDQPLPPHRGAGFLEVDPHHDEQIRRQPIGDDFQAAPVVARGRDVMNGTRTHDHQQAVFLAAQNPGHGPPTLLDQDRNAIVQRQLVDDDFRGDQRTDLFDPEVVGPPQRHPTALAPASARLAWTAAASSSSTGTVCSQPRQASVMLCP